MRNVRKQNAAQSAALGTAQLPGSRWQGRDFALALVIAAGAFLLYVPTFYNDFVAYDDPHYIQEQPMVLGGLSAAGVRWAFSTTTFANWLPITWLTHQLDVQLWGLRAGGHHATSALLHAVNAALLFAALRGMTGSRARSAVVAEVFAVHPLRVESVAWVAERKDVLAGTFFLLMLCSYARYCRKPSFGRYALVALCLALGLMSKTMLVSAPVLLLLLDYWPLRRLAVQGQSSQPTETRQNPQRSVGWLIAEKIPLLAMALIASGWTVVLQRQGGAMQGGEVLSLSQRLANAVVSVPRYLDKTVRPIDLSVFYPHPGSWPMLTVLLSAILIVVMTGIAVACARSRPYVAVGWFWFLGMLVPVSGVVQVGLQSMADRYTYLPGIGLLVMTVWALAALLAARPALHRLAKPVLAILLLALSAATILQQRYWANTFTLFTHAYVVDPGNWLANDMVGVELSRSRNYPAASAYLERAVALNPNHVEPHHNYGDALLNLGRTDEAIGQFMAAISIKPLSISYELLGDAYAQKRLWPEAIAAYVQADALSPGRPDVHAGWGQALLGMGRNAEAMTHFNKALAVDPRNELALAGIARAREPETRPSR